MFMILGIGLSMLPILFRLARKLRLGIHTLRSPDAHRVPRLVSGTHSPGGRRGGEAREDHTGWHDHTALQTNGGITFEKTFSNTA